MRRSATRLNTRMTATMTALAKTNNHARVRLTVRKWMMTNENRAQATTRAASPRKV